MRDFLFDSDFYKKLFNKDPNFDVVDLCGFQIKDSVAYLSIDLVGVTPDNPPKAWSDRSYNSVQLQFGFIGISNLFLSKFHGLDRGRLLMIKCDEGYGVEFLGEYCSLRLMCEFLSIGGVSAYLRE